MFCSARLQSANQSSVPSGSHFTPDLSLFCSGLNTHTHTHGDSPRRGLFVYSSVSGSNSLHWTHPCYSLNERSVYLATASGRAEGNPSEWADISVCTLYPWLLLEWAYSYLHVYLYSQVLFVYVFMWACVEVSVLSACANTQRHRLLSLVRQRRDSRK